MNIEYQIIRSNRRTVALVITTAGELTVRAPNRATKKQIHEIVMNHQNWIQKKKVSAQTRKSNALSYESGDQLLFDGKAVTLQFDENLTKKIAGQIAVVDDRLLVSQNLAGNRLAVEKAIKNFYKHETAVRMLPITKQLENQTKLKVKKVGVTFARSRWGSCASSGSINFSFRLAQTDPFVQHYLAVHEMAHLIHANHSVEFWNLVKEWMPNYKEAEQWLKQHRLQLKL